MEYIKALHNLIFPTNRLCYFCGETSYKIENYLCKNCISHLEVLNREIEMDSVYIQKAYYSLMYNRIIREIMRDFKFSGKSYLYKPLAEIMLSTLEEVGVYFDIILFVPSHRRKEAIRGYNQSELLARYISKALSISLSTNNLIKTKHTKDQNKLNKTERMRNLRNAFKVRNKKEVQNKDILLVDDIITTGSTLMECAKVLKDAGALEITGLGLTSSKTV